MMRAGISAAITLAAIAAGWTGQVARAQDNPNPEQQKKMYDDALQQLKAAQERKNQLAAENEKLKQQIETLNNELTGRKAQLDELRLIDASHAEKTFFLRAHYMAWQEFTKLNPETAAKWRLYMESSYLLSGPVGVSIFDREWPLRVEKPAPATQPSPNTQAATAPAPAALPTTQPVPTTHPTTPEAPTTQPVASQPATAPAATITTTEPATKP